MKKERDSNFELLRIVLMLSIIAHHYVVNSGVMDNFSQNISNNMMFLQLWGMWGKMAINIFVLITGYFMCKFSLKLIKVVKLIAEVVFYDFIVFIVLYMWKVQVTNFKEIFNLFFGIFQGINNGFTASFIAFYILIPFINRLINNLSKQVHLKLNCLLLFIYTICGTFFKAPSFSYIGWYITLYLVASYIRLYPNKYTESLKLGLIATVICILVSYASVILLDQFKYQIAYYFVIDSNKLLALFTAISIFILFKNLRIKHSKIINAIASTTFGVLLIHANSDAMRKFLWQDLLNVPGIYNNTLGYVIIHAVISMILVYLVCVVIDLIRIKFIEKPFLNKIEKLINNSRFLKSLEFENEKEV